MKRRTWLSWALGLGLVTPSACSTGGLNGVGGNSSEFVENESAELTANETTQCDGQLAEKSDVSCTGAWKYMAYDACQNKECGCAQYKSCPDWSFGVDPVRVERNFSSTLSVQQTCLEVCVPCSQPEASGSGGEDVSGCDCTEQTCSPPKWDAAKAQCESNLSAKITQIKAGVPDAYDHLVQTVPGSFVFTQFFDNNDLPKATCAFRIYEPKPATGTGAVCDCKTYKSCPNDECLVSGPYWSPEGLTVVGLRNAATNLNKLLYEGADKPFACSTCDSYIGDASVNARYSCLETFSAQVPAARLSAVERTQMLVYETYGYNLSSSAPSNWLGDARALYSHASSVPACGVVVPSYVCNGGASGPAGQAGVDFTRCLRLQGSHVASATGARELAVCAEAFAANAATYAACTSPSGGPSAANEGLTALDAVWQKQLGAFKPLSAPLSQLGRQVLNFDLWYAGHAALLSGGAAPSPAQVEALAGDLSEANALFWAAIDEHFGVTKSAVEELNEATPSQQDLRAALTTALTKGDVGAREVVKAIFTPFDKGNGQVVLPAGGLPLFALLGEALGALGERLDDQSVYHDFGCQLRDCRVNATSSSVVQLYRVLGNLDQAGAFTAALNAASGDLGGWKPALQKLNENRARFDAAVQAATLGKGLAAADVDAVPAPARPLVRLVRNARERAARFDATGRFLPTARLLDSGQDLDTREDVVNALNAKLAKLVARKDRYDNDLVSLARETLGVMSEAAELTRIENVIAQKDQIRQNLEADAKGLQGSADQEASRLGDILAAFSQIEAGLDQNQLIDVGNSVTFPVTGGHAKYLGSGGGADVAALSVREPIAVAQGQLLQVQTTGSWSPTCALRSNATQMLKPLDLGETPKPVSVDLSDTVIGPEGFSLQWTGSGFRAGSSTKANAQAYEVGVRGEVCARDPGPVDEFGVSYSVCAFASATFSHSYTSASNDGNEIRATSTFSRGLRLPKMPFPEAPVGALLAVTKAKATGTILDVQVVQSPQTMVFAQQDADVYFVVNDRGCVSPELPVTKHALTVRANTLVTVQQVAKKVVEAMNEVVGTVRPYELTYAEQGRILPSQISALRSQTALKLEAKLASLNPPLSIDDLPAPLLTLFNAFVDREIVRIERAVELKAIDRQIGLIDLEVESLRADKAANGEQSAARNLLLGHMLRNLDGEVLRVELAELVVATRDYLLPMLELWYPKYLASKQNEPTFNDKLKVLSESGNLNGDLTVLANAAAYVVGELLDGFLEAPFGNKPQGAQLPIVLLSYPRPGVRQPNDLTGDFDSHWRIADGVRSMQVWQAILRRQTAHVTINADDIYARSSTQGTLPCTEATPVIRGIRFMFGSTKNGAYSENGDLLNGLGRTLGGLAPENQSFLTELGEAHYLLAPWSVYRVMSGSVLYGPDVSLRTLADNSFTNDDSTRPVGLSPLGTYDIDFSDIDAEWPGSVGLGIDEAEEFVVAMQIDSKAVATPLSGVAVCNP